MKFKSGTKYTWEGWKSSGRESWVFRVDHPRELMGVHAKLIDKALFPHEKIEYCLYSPRKSASSEPFGLKTEEASHGVCVTDRRFIISQNRHIDGIDPALISIDFKNILYCNIGRAALLGWFSIGYIQDSKIARVTITFNSTGKEHFEKAFRAYKKQSMLLCETQPDIASFSVGSFIHRIYDPVHRDHLRKLMTRNEQCIGTFRCRYVWRVTRVKKLFQRKTRQSTLASNATFFLTNRTLLIARDNVGFSISSSIDVLCIPLERMRSFLLSKKNEDEDSYKLEIFFNNNSEVLTHNFYLTSDSKKAEELFFYLSVLLKQVKRKACGCPLE